MPHTTYGKRLLLRVWFCTIRVQVINSQPLVVIVLGKQLMMGYLLVYISVHLLVSCSVPTIQSAEYEERAAVVTAADMSQQTVIIGVFISTQHMSAFEDSVRNQSDMRLVIVYKCRAYCHHSH